MPLLKTDTTQSPWPLRAPDRAADGPAREPAARAAVAVQGDRIVAVGETGDLAARFPGATRVDYAGATLMPGMVDSHVHVTFSASAVPFEDIQNDGDVTVGLRGAINARDALLAGVTLLRDLGGRQRTTIELRNAITAAARPRPPLSCRRPPGARPHGRAPFLRRVAPGGLARD